MIVRMHNLSFFDLGGELVVTLLHEVKKSKPRPRNWSIFCSNARLCHSVLLTYWRCGGGGGLQGHMAGHVVSFELVPKLLVQCMADPFQLSA